MPPRSSFKGKKLAPIRSIGQCQRILDTSLTLIEAKSWFGAVGRDPESHAERQAEALLKANANILHEFHISANVQRRNSMAFLSFHSSSRIGALPLVSPVTGKTDLGLIVEPRFAWSSIGEVLTATGFRVVPKLLSYAELPQSDRKIPPWVLSSIVLLRIKGLLDKLSRKFRVIAEDVAMPKGAVDWDSYAIRKITHAKHLFVPCTFPDLRDDFDLRSAIHFVLKEHSFSLMAQRSAGVVVVKLLALCNELIARVTSNVPRRPNEGQIQIWRRGALMPKAVRDGLQAIEWTLEERGLAGLNELSGLSWQMDMESFFEAWAETIGEQVSKKCGASLRVGRLGQTKISLDWKPSYFGSQRAFIPDVVLARGDVTMILDAKYKAHAEEIQSYGWGNIEEEVRERHRNDLLQVVAYSSLFDTQRVVACLIYPCRIDTFQSLLERNQVVVRSCVNSGTRVVEIVLVSVPMSSDAGEVVTALSKVFQNPSD